MKRALTTIAIFSACALPVAVLGGVIDLAPGSPVPDNVAAQLCGGTCAGVHANTGCMAVDPCANNGWGSGGSMDNDVNNVTAYWCVTKMNGNLVCNTCSAGYVSCAGG